MLEKLGISQFKCIDAFEEPLSALTLLTGLNASGKSSVIQALALLHQTVVDHEWSKRIHLNGSSIRLGSMYDVINRETGGRGFEVMISKTNWRVNWTFESEDRNRDLAGYIENLILEVDGSSQTWRRSDLERLEVRRLIPTTFHDSHQYVFESMQEALENVTYIGAERVGPREVYDIFNPTRFPDVGSRGEKTAWILEELGGDQISPGMALPGVATLVRPTVEAWMSQLFPGFKLQIKRVDSTNLLTMGLRTQPKGDFFRPSNVGFGLTQVLPVITACIAAKAGATILIENPEIHLHPAAQSQIGLFLGIAAASGIQVIVESHSDHVLNGIRRAVRDQRLPHHATAIFFFGDRPEAEEGKVTPVSINSDGQLGNWPPGFFDQIEADLDYLFPK